METFEDDNPKNLYVIRRKLASLKKVAGLDYYEYGVGHFVVTIYTREIQDRVQEDYEPGPMDDNILKHETVDMALNECHPGPKVDSVHLTEDPRFKYCKSIQYNVITTPTGGTINLSNGNRIPILQLCELIRLLHRLSNLTAFM